MMLEFCFFLFVLFLFLKLFGLATDISWKVVFAPLAFIMFWVVFAFLFFVVVVSFAARFG